MAAHAFGINATTLDEISEDTDIRNLAKEFLMYKIGDFVNRFYFPVFIPIGIIGNLLSFLVMVQRHNRHSSVSLYLAVLTVPDTILLCHGLVVYLTMVHGVYIWPGQEWYCCVTLLSIFMCFLRSTLLILSMTFDRFYSIIQPHKAASFNTVKRAKITITCIVIVSFLYNIPHMFFGGNVNWECVPYGGALGTVFGETYYWMSLVIQFVISFVLLLIMNSIIIHKIRTRSVFKQETILSGDIKCIEKYKTKNSESQMFAVLLLVTFTFIILTTPAYAFFLYIRIVDFSKSPGNLAIYYLFYNCAQKMQYSNNGINFFLYVISGRKFRTELRNFFPCLNQKKENKGSLSTQSENP